MVSSRKEGNVQSAVEQLRQVDGGKVEGVVCHVGKSDHRENLIKTVSPSTCEVHVAPHICTVNKGPCIVQDSDGFLDNSSKGSIH